MYNQINQEIKKEFEYPAEVYLDKNMPVIVRIDGRAFHTFTRGFKKPFDKIFRETMQETMLRLCESIENCVFGYEQSDEITLVLVKNDNELAEPWFNNRVKKIVSNAASMATLYFNKILAKKTSELADEHFEAWNVAADEEKYLHTLERAVEMGAIFSVTCFSIPDDRVFDAIYARQLDAIKNSISSTGRTFFKQSELHKKSSKEVLEMLEARGVDWTQFPIENQRGASCYKVPIKVNSPEYGEITRNKFRIDMSMPELRADGSNREYIDKILKGEMKNE